MRMGEKPVGFKTTQKAGGIIEIAATTSLTTDEAVVRHRELLAAIENYDVKIAYFQRQRQLALDEITSLEPITMPIIQEQPEENSPI